MPAHILRTPAFDDMSGINFESLSLGGLEVGATDYHPDNPRIVYVKCKEDEVEVHSIPGLRLGMYTVEVDPDLLDFSIDTGEYRTARLEPWHTHRERVYDYYGTKQQLVVKHVGSTALPLRELLDVESHMVYSTN